MFDNNNNEPEDIFSGTDAQQPSMPPQNSQPPMQQMEQPMMNAMPPVGQGGKTIPTQPSGELAPELPSSSGGRKLVIAAIIIVVVVVVLLAVLIGLWFVRQNQDTPPASEQSPTSQQLVPPAETDEEEDVQEDIQLEEGDPTFEENETVSPLPPQDTDGDGLTDEEESSLGTNPESPDSDSDGLSDTEEIRIWNTDPLDADSDDDGFNDGDEVDNGYDPNQEGGVLLQLEAN